jgi:hypothetical protein
MTTTPAEDSGLFESELHIEVSASVTHPPGTTFDNDGKPIPPKADENK